VAVVDCEPEDLPEMFQRVKVEADKTAIKDAIKTAVAAAVAVAPSDEAAAKAAAVATVKTVPGCTLVERRSWSIK
jgi:hypothetical protein